jgi:diaminopimelate epimerase
MDIPFIKMHGAGNDYVYLDLIRNDKDLDLKDLDFNDLDFNDLALRISSRHFGVGSDGLILIMRGGDSPFRMRMFNADGSESEMCGNGIRCVAKYLHDEGYAGGDTMSIDTLAGAIEVEIVARDGRGRATQARVDMGEPVLDGPHIPVKDDGNPVRGLRVGKYSGTAVSMGNPHYVVFVDAVTDSMVLQDGPAIETDPLFPNRTNVEFAEVVDRHRVKMRVWERGTGETLACGTGACAVGVAAILNDLTERSLDVELPGGVLRIEWDGRVYLTGPAVEVFRGTFPY